MKEYRGRRYRYVNNLCDMQAIFNIAEDNSLIVFSDFEYHHKINSLEMRDVSYITNTDRYYTITTMYVKEVHTRNGIEYKETYDKYVCTWILDKTDTEFFHIHPSSVARRSNNVYKPFNVVNHKELSSIWDVTADGKILQSAKPIIGYNPKYDGTEHYVVCYDLNSAYGQPLLDKIPDTYRMECYRNVGENEVGFLFDDNLTMVDKVGEYADFVFPLIDSPYKDYVKHWFSVKKNSPKGSKDRDLAKQILVITVGLWQNVNPFLRAYVVNKCNKEIQSLLNRFGDKICCWNTDAVYCTEHIPFLDERLGDDIGQFKLEYEGLFRQKGNNYQKIEEGSTTYRGILKCLFKKDFNILTDELPKVILPYKMNKETYMIEKNPMFIGE